MTGETETELWSVSLPPDDFKIGAVKYK